MFPIRKVDQLQAEDIEYLGTKRKFWFTAAGQRYLFKAEERGTGEDWAEKVVCELARCLSIPHVEYELAHQFEGQNPIQPGATLRRQESGWANWEKSAKLQWMRFWRKSRHNECRRLRENLLWNC